MREPEIKNALRLPNIRDVYSASLKHDANQKTICFIRIYINLRGSQELDGAQIESINFWKCNGKAQMRRNSQYVRKNEKKNHYQN